MSIGTYEQSCIDFALYGSQEQEHWDHEANAEYDRFDGLRGDFPPNEDPYCNCLIHDDLADYGTDAGDDWVQATTNDFFFTVELGYNR